MPTVHYQTVRPYQTLTGHPRAIARPLLRVRIVNGPITTNELLAIVDSGADVSTFHVDVATLAGLDLCQYRRQTTRGIGGPAETWVCAVELAVEGRQFAAEVNFTAAIPQSLL